MYRRILRYPSAGERPSCDGIISFKEGLLSFRGRWRCLVILITSLLITPLLLHHLGPIMDPLIPSVVHGEGEGFNLKAHLQEAAAMYYRGDLEGSAGLYREILSRYPEKNDVRLNLAAVYKDAGEPEKAAREYEYILSSGGGGDGILFELGWTRFCAGDYEGAVEALQTAYRLEPGRSSDILYALGLAESRLGRDKEAISHLTTAIESNPRHALARLELGNLFMRLGRFQEAASSYENALKYEPALKGLHFLVGEAYLRLEESARALEALEKASRVEPANKAVAARLEEVKEERPDLVQAKAEAKAASRRNLSLPRVNIPVDLGSIPRVRIRLLSDAREVRFQVGGDFSVISTSGPLPEVLPRDDKGVPFYVPLGEKGSPQPSIIGRGGVGEEWTIRRVDGSFEVLRGDGSIGRVSLPRLAVVPHDPATVTLFYDLTYGAGYFWAGEEDRSYRGVFEFVGSRDKDSFMVINEVSLEEYLYSVVPSEMSAYWPAEALKAQAVAARSYTLRRLNLNKGAEYQVDSSVRHAYYMGVKGESLRSTMAVDETRGEVLYHGNTVIDAVYSSNSGGYVESSSDVWGGGAPYLKGKWDLPVEKKDPSVEFPLAPAQLHEWIKTSPFSFSQPGRYGSPSTYRWRSVISRLDIERDLKNSGMDVGILRGITPLERGEGGVVKAVNFRGTKGSYVVRGDNIRSILGGLKSNRFVMETSYGKDGLPEQFFFYGSGYGHLVGMSQTGAANMADMGYNYKEILEHYYSGVAIRRAY